MNVSLAPTPGVSTLQQHPSQTHMILKSLMVAVFIGSAAMAFAQSHTGSAANPDVQPICPPAGCGGHSGGGGGGGSTSGGPLSFGGTSNLGFPSVVYLDVRVRE
jgi:hypothetical protein